MLFCTCEVRRRARGSGLARALISAATGANAVGIDWTVDPLASPFGAAAARTSERFLPVQGNLDPLALGAGGEALAQAVERMLSGFRAMPHIFNLGHGILPGDTRRECRTIAAIGAVARAPDEAGERVNTYNIVKSLHIISIIAWRGHAP